MTRTITRLLAILFKHLGLGDLLAIHLKPLGLGDLLANHLKPLGPPNPGPPPFEAALPGGATRFLKSQIFCFGIFNWCMMEHRSSRRAGRWTCGNRG